MDPPDASNDPKLRGWRIMFPWFHIIKKVISCLWSKNINFFDDYHPQKIKIERFQRKLRLSDLKKESSRFCFEVFVIRKQYQLVDLQGKNLDLFNSIDPTQLSRLRGGYSRVNEDILPRSRILMTSKKLNIKDIQKKMDIRRTCLPRFIEVLGKSCFTGEIVKD